MESTFDPKRHTLPLRKVKNNQRTYNLRGRTINPFENSTMTFALTPADLHKDDILDLSNSDDKKMYLKSKKPLETEYDGTLENLSIFQEELTRRIKDYAWSGTGDGNIIQINNKDLIYEYGQITKDQIISHANNYLNKPKRAAQNNVCMFNAIMDSLTKDSKTTIVNEKQAYQVGGVDSAPLLYKLIIGKAIVDTKATAAQYRTSLLNLDKYMLSVESDIQKFNEHVRTCRQGLAARGERVDDLILNLFKGCQAASDRKFLQYIEMKELAYTDESQSFTADVLITYTEKKYKTQITLNQ